MVAKAERIQRLDDLEDERVVAIRQCMKLERAAKAAQETITAAVHAWVVINREYKDARRLVEEINREMGKE